MWLCRIEYEDLIFGVYNGHVLLFYILSFPCLILYNTQPHLYTDKAGMSSLLILT